MTITPQISSPKKEIVATSLFDHWAKVSQLSDIVTCERTQSQILFSLKP